MHALRRADGDARSGAGHAVDARSILGVPAMRKTLLDNLSSAGSRQGETGCGAGVMRLGDDEIDDDIDDDDDDVPDTDEDDDEDDDQDDDDEEEETWQVQP
jgi:hypothetical protein